MKLTEKFLLQTVPTGLEDEELSEETARLAQLVEERLATGQEEMGTVTKDPRLTASGKREELLRMGEQTVESIARLCRLTRQSHETEEAKIEKEILDPRVRLKVPVGIDPDDARAAEAAAREMIREMEPTERQLLYERALETGDALTVRAFELLPPSVQMVEIPDDASERFAAAAFPERFDRLENLRAAMDHATWCARWGGEVLTKLVGAETLGTEKGPVAELEGAGAE